MKIYCLFLLLFLSSLVYAEEKKPPEIAAEKLLDQRENYFQTSTSYQITPNVNPITGDLIEEDIDLVVAGSEPLSVRRFYNHTAIYEPRTGGWRYNPETFFAANFEWPEQEIFAAVGEYNGSVASFKPSNGPYIYAFDFPKSFAHFNPSGQTHPLNTKIEYGKIGDTKDKYRFFWKGIITDGSGTQRHFASRMHTWLRNIHFTTGKKNYFSSGEKEYWVATPNVWTPYQIPIHEEHKPNGNIICYSYVRWKDDKLYPKPPLLNSITAYNADRTKTLGSISFYYNKDNHEEVHGLTAVGSDGRQLAIYHHGSSPILLTAAYAPGKPWVSYGYQGQWINQVVKPEGRLITTEYDSTGKVAAQYAPVGPKGEMHPIGRYTYHNQATEVYDAEDNKTLYRFNEHKQLLSLETYKDGQLYRINRLTWDPTTGNLLKKTLEDASGNALQITEYTYDKHHNPITEKIGDGKEWRTIHRTFSEDGLNLKLSESDREGKTTRYRYVPNTNLLSSELIYENDTPCKRTFHFYDDCAICIKTIHDDGHTEDPQNLQGVTYRKITQITPKQKLPCFGLPEVVEEKTIDPTGQEILLHKTVYTYTPFGKVHHEEHYDAKGTYRYSLHNDYDDKERLISQTDPLGHKTTLTYDINHNLTTVLGPKPDQHREIIYDKANRPIQIADWQTDGTVLITEKKYDKLGRVIEEIDPCKNSTRFEYDALGRLIATFYPDGAITRKEYDPLDHVIKEIDAKGYETQRTYNGFGQITSIHYPDGSQETFTYHPTGTLASHTDKNGALSLYTYDLFDHLLKTDTYSPSHKLLKTLTAIWTPLLKLSETEGDLTTHYTYDYAGRKIEERKAYRHTHYLYDELNRLSITQEGETQLIETHDVKDQLTEKRREHAGTLQFKEAYVYDENGNCIQVINSQGVAETVFNTSNQPLTFTDPLGFITQYHYSYTDPFTQTTTDPKGLQSFSIHDSCNREARTFKKNLQGDVIQHSENVYDKNSNLKEVHHTIYSGVIPLKTITHRWEYGPMGRIERFMETGIRETRYLYDDKGRLHTLIKPNGRALRHEYDDLGRLSRFYSRDFDYHYTYDQNDRVTSIYDKISKTTTTRVYDPLDNLLQEKLATDLSFQNAYDALGRRSTLTLPDASNIAYTYNGFYLHQVQRGSYTHTYSKRNLEGQITQARLSDTSEMSIQRDKLGRYAHYHSPYYTSIFSKEAYDGNGNLLAYKAQDLLGQIEYQFAYDDLDQLISEDKHSYQFDSLHNRLKKDDSTYTIDDFCQVNHDGNVAYAYDGCGNLISDGTHKYFYDSLGRLIAIEEGNQRVEYTYDPFHRRLSKTVYSKGSKIKRIRYLWDGDHEIGSINEKNDIQELRILGEGLGAEIGSAVLYELQGKSYLPIHDHRGCVVALVDLKTKKPLECYRYDAFGEELTKNRLSPWRFASKRVDEETNLVFFGRRYYLPTLGRFITQDPEGFGDGPNLYAYLHNCPLNDCDPYGLWGMGEMWDGTCDFLGGALDYGWSGLKGVGQCMGQMGEWMHADFQYEYFNDRSFFLDKSYRATEEWKDLGRAVKDDPFGVMMPGLMEAWRNPTSPAAWGKAAVDVGLIGFSAMKVGRAAVGIGRAGRVGEGLVTCGKTEISLAERMTSPTSTRIAGFTEHGMQRAIQRGVNEKAIFDALTNPLQVREIKIDHLGRPSQRFIGREAEVVINPSTNQIVSVNPTSTKKIEKLTNPKNK